MQMVALLLAFYKATPSPRCVKRKRDFFKGSFEESRLITHLIYYLSDKQIEVKSHFYSREEALNATPEGDIAVMTVVLMNKTFLCARTIGD